MNNSSSTQDFLDAVRRADLKYLQTHVGDQSIDDLNWFVRKIAEIGDVECLKVLLEKCHSLNSDGQHALSRATEFRHVQCVTELLKHPDIDPTYAANSALCFSLQNNDPICTALLTLRSNYLMDHVHKILDYPLQRGYIQCLQCIIDDLHRPQRFDELVHCVLDAAEHGAYEVAQRLAPHNTTVLQQILNTHDPYQHSNAAVWLTDRLLKVHLDVTLQTNTSSKRKI